MALAQLRPANIWQTYNGYVTKKNSPPYRVGNGYSVFLEYDITNEPWRNNLYDQAMGGLYTSPFEGYGNSYSANYGYDLTIDAGGKATFATETYYYEKAHKTYTEGMKAFRTTTGKYYVEVSRPYESSGEFSTNGFYLWAKHADEKPDTQFSVTGRTGGFFPSGDFWTFKSINSSYVFYGRQVVGGTVYYKKSTESDYAEQAFTGTTFAPNFESNSDYVVKFRVTFDDGTQSYRSIEHYFTTKNDVLNVTLVQPINMIESGDVLFRWSVSSPNGCAQMAYDLEIGDGSTWNERVADHVVTESTSARISVLNHSGRILWRVRAYNYDDVPSEWSETLSLINNVPPVAPTILNVTPSSLPTVSWNANDQIAFCVTLKGDNKEYTSGVTYSADRSYTFNEFVPDGSYAVELYIYNTLGSKSNTATSYASITGEKVELRGNVADFVELKVLVPNDLTTSDGDNIMVSPANVEYLAAMVAPEEGVWYLLRDGKYVGCSETGEFIDRYAAGNVEYTAYSVTDGGVISASTNLFVPFKNRLISADGEELLINRRWSARLAPQRMVEADTSVYRFLGAYKQKVFTTGLTARNFTLQISGDEAEMLVGKECFLTLSSGVSAWVVPVSISVINNWYGSDTIVRLTETMYEFED